MARTVELETFPTYQRPVVKTRGEKTGRTGWAWSDPRRTHVCMVTVREDGTQYTDCGIKLAYFSNTRPPQNLYPTCPGCMAARSWWRKELLLNHVQPYGKWVHPDEVDPDRPPEDGWTLGTEEGELKTDALPADYINGEYTQQTASSFEDYVIAGLEEDIELIKFVLRRH